jgi:hypothetical protein
MARERKWFIESNPSHFFGGGGGFDITMAVSIAFIFTE